MKFFDLILEGRVDEFKTRYGKKFTPEQLDRIVNNVPQKFLDWVGKVYDAINFDENFNLLITKLKEFDKISSNLPITDINGYKSLGELDKAIENYSQRARRDYTKMEGGNVVYDDGRYFVVNPQTHKASCYYGKGTKWCTAADSDHHFNQYNKDGKLFYILDRNLESSDPYYKIALLQKFDGEKYFYDATDNSTNLVPAQIGTKKFEEIMSAVQEYLNKEYAEQIKLVQDREREKRERERERRREAQRQLNLWREEANERRMENEWALGPDCPEEGLKAHALLLWLEDQQDIEIKTNEDILRISEIQSEILRLQTEYDESEDVKTELLDEISGLEDELEELNNKIDVYNIIPNGEYYDTTQFIVIDADLHGREYAVGTEDEVRSSCQERVKQLIDDIGYEGFNRNFVSNHLDVEAIADYAEEIFDYDVRENPDVYFDDSQRNLSEDQESEINDIEYKIEKIRNDIERMEMLKDGENDDEIDEKIEELQDAITDYEDEIESIKDNPEGEFDETLINERVQELVDDAKDRPEGFLSDYGLEMDRFVDEDEFIDAVINEDGYGHTLNGYDGNADEMKVEGEWYYVMRID